MNFSASRFQNQPPERGSFPLDHDRACTPLRDEFLACLKAEGNEHVACRALSERYLACRMDKNLMARDAMENIGFGAAPAPNARVVTEGDRERVDFMDALGAAFDVMLEGGGGNVGSGTSGAGVLLRDCLIANRVLRAVFHTPG